MSDVTIWHNPRCSKSRQTLELLRENGVNPVIVEYLKNPPSAAEIEWVIAQLGISAINLVRSNEAEFKASDLTRNSSAASLIAAMAATPKLIERPIVIKKAKAAIGRPPEAVLKVL